MKVTMAKFANAAERPGSARNREQVCFSPSENTSPISFIRDFVVPDLSFFFFQMRIFLPTANGNAKSITQDQHSLSLACIYTDNFPNFWGRSRSLCAVEHRTHEHWFLRLGEYRVDALCILSC
jgi:hypothetical protein